MKYYNICHIIQGTNTQTIKFIIFKIEFYINWDLLALFVGQRLCINFSVSKANFLTTLRSHLDATRSCYFWSSLFHVDFKYSYIHLVNYSCSLKWAASVLDPHLRRRCTKSKNDLIIGIIDNHGLALAKWTFTVVVFHSKGQSLTVLCFLVIFLLCVPSIE